MRPVLEGHREADVVILGAGVVGCIAARDLARRGYRVIVLEPGAVAESADSQGHVPIGLRIPYRVARGRFGEEATRDIWTVHRENHERLKELLAEIGSDVGYRQAGGFRFATTRDGAADLAESEDLLRDDGFSGEFFDHYMLEARFDLAGFAAGYWAAEEGEVDSAALVTALAAAAEHDGAVIHERSAAIRLEVTEVGVDAGTETGRARGAWAVLADDEAAIRLVPSLRSLLTVRAASVVRLETDGSLSIPSPGLSCEEPVRWRAHGSEVLLESVAPEALQEFGRMHFPRGIQGLKEGRSGTWAVTVDGLPLVGPIDRAPMIASCGYGWMSYAYAFLAARWVAEAIGTGRDPTPPFLSPSRAKLE